MTVEDILERLSETETFVVPSVAPSFAVMVALAVTLALLLASCVMDGARLPIIGAGAVELGVFAVMIMCYFFGTEATAWNWLSLTLLCAVGFHIGYGVYLWVGDERGSGFLQFTAATAAVATIVLAFVTPPLGMEREARSANADMFAEQMVAEIQESIESRYDVQVTGKAFCDAYETDVTFVRRAVGEDVHETPGLEVIAHGVVGCYRVMFDGADAQLLSVGKSDMPAPVTLVKDTEA